jgi:hypothetical protein
MATQANSISAFKIDRADVMKAAWIFFRLTRARYAAWQFDRNIVDGSFAAALRTAWRVAKDQRARSLQHAAVEAAKNGPNGHRIRAIQSEIDGLSHKSLRYDIGAMRRRLESELANLVAA